MKINNSHQLIYEFSKVRNEKKFDLNDLFFRVFHSQEFDECEHEMLIAYLVMRLKLLENRIEKLEGYIHG